MAGLSPLQAAGTEKVHILMVDDREDGLLALEMVLKRPEYHLVKAASGREALALLLEHDFALILLDVQMPEMDGFETARLIKRNDLFKHIPIIFVTAISKHQSHIERGYDSGAVDYIFKPFEPHVLRSKVEVFVDLYRKNLRIREQTHFLLQSERRERERRVEEIRKEDRKRYENLADAIPHMVLRTDPEGRAEYLNSYWITYTGLGSEESMQDGWVRALHEEDRREFLRRFGDARAHAAGEGVDVECRILRKSDGAPRWHLVKLIPELQEGKVAAWIATCTEIHERREAKEELEFKVSERTLELSLVNRALEKEMEERARAQREVLEVSEREQKRISRDLHDGLAQELVAISFMSQILEQKLRESGFEGVADAQRIQVLLKKAVEWTRNLSRWFYPIELERHGLLAAVQEMVVNTEKMFPVEVLYRHDPGISIRDRAAAFHLYRIVQEAVHNAVKHGKARTIQVSITREDDTLCLAVKDDGAGFRVSDPAPGGMGLRTMHYRARAIGAVLTVESGPGKGTQVSCRAVLSETPRGALETEKEKTV